MNEPTTAPTTPIIRVLLNGANGRMGQALLRLAATDARLRIVAAVARTVGQRVVDGIPHYGSDEVSGVPEFDVAIDFSLPAGFDAMLALCARRGAALVSGTTGLDDAQRGALARVATRVPVLWSSNFSLGIAVLARLVEQAAHALPDWDCDVIEAHHVHKRDAPSGTALTLGAAAESQGARPTYASIRAGDIVGEHTVQFASQGERIELIHRATSRGIFARGALHAAIRLAGRPAGRYSLGELLD